MPRQQRPHLPERRSRQMVKSRMAPPMFSEREKKAMLTRFRSLKGPARAFVSEIFEKARKARGRLDDDVYGVLQATMEALQQTGGLPPPLVFGVSHYETGKVEQVGFVPTGVKKIPPGGRFVTNHPSLRPPDQPGGPPQLKG